MTLRKIEIIKQLNKIRMGLNDIDILKLQEESDIETKRATVIHNLRNSGLPASTMRKGLETVIPKNKYQKELLKLLKFWEPPNRLPYIYGLPGTGKTYIAAAFLSTFIQKTSKEAQFCYISQLFIETKGEYNISNHLTNLKHTQLLVLDDLGPHNITRSTLELLHYLIDYRLRYNMPTLITSNTKIDTLGTEIYKVAKKSGITKNICEAIEDRMFELCSIFNLDGGSVRLKDAIARL